MIDKHTWDTLKNKKIQFTIPMYQRKYSWTKVEVGQLLKDLEEWDSGNYFIGNIVVEEKEGKNYDVVDGQQRLTTLYLLGALCTKVIPFDLHYTIRENDQNFLQKLSKLPNGSTIEDIALLHKSCQADLVFLSNIAAIYDYYEVKLGESIQDTIVSELLDKVEFMITRLDAKKFDIAKYFEVMNNRGKQLEKHEILKSYFLSDGSNDKWSTTDRYKYSVIWDYCSRMDNYFEDFIYLYESNPSTKNYTSVRHFISKGFFNISDMESLIKIKKDTVGEKNNTTSRQKIQDLLNDEGIKEIKSREGIDEYRSIIKFSYFLLQILNIYFVENGKENEISNTYNDAKLLERYKNMVAELSIEEKKNFIYFLFKMRILFDYYIFRREPNHKQSPYLKQIVYSNDKEYHQKIKNLKLLNIEILFNATSDFFTQDWIAPTLKFLQDKTKESKALFSHYKSLREYLSALDKRIAFERINNGKLQDIYTNNILASDIKIETLVKPSFGNILNKGTSTERYWFYKLDYLLWKDYLSEKKYWPLGNLGLEKAEQIGKFELKNLGSVEHVFPQNPNQESGSCVDKKDEWSDCLNRFGNLALISSHMNSKLNNQCPKKKWVDIEAQIKKGTLESLKMLLIYKKYEQWDIAAYEDHHTAMIKLLEESWNESFDVSID